MHQYAWIMTTGILLALLPSFISLAMAACAPKPKMIESEISQRVLEGIAHGRGSFDHSKFDAILRQYAKPDRHQFDYAALKPHQADLETYLHQVAQANISALSRDELLALLVNAYNACTIESILKAMTPDRPLGVASILDVPDVFDVKIHVVGGTELSLNNIENNLLRPIFKDPRIHFAVNCASFSCPPLSESAYTGGKVDEQLDTAARRTLQSPDYVRIENGRLLVTKILEWYGSDFVTPGYRGATGSLAEFINRYATNEVRQFIAARGSKTPVEFMSYNWSLNRVR